MNRTSASFQGRLRTGCLCLPALALCPALAGCLGPTPLPAPSANDVLVDIRAVDGATGQALPREDLRTWRSAAALSPRGGATATRISTRTDGHALVTLAPGWFTCVEAVAGVMEGTGTWISVDHAGGPVRVYTPGALPEWSAVPPGGTIDVRVWRPPAESATVVIPAGYVGKIEVEGDGVAADRTRLGVDGVVHLSDAERARSVAFVDELGQALNLIVGAAHPDELALRAVEIPEPGLGGTWTVLLVGTGADADRVHATLPRCAVERRLNIRDAWHALSNTELGFGQGRTSRAPVGQSDR